MPSSQHLFSTLSSQTPINTSDLFLVLAALLCVFIFIIGLALLARCTCFRTIPSTPPPPPPPPKGLDKSALEALPITSFQSPSRTTECPICLTEFQTGDGIRVLSGCGHSFHVNCVDAWFRSHSSCPFCRTVYAVVEDNKQKVLAMVRCEKCGIRSSDS